MELRKDVDWAKVEGEMRVWGRRDLNWEEEKSKGRGGLERVGVSLEDNLSGILERYRGRRKWKGERKNWWDEELEVARKGVREAEKGWERGVVVGREEVMERRKEYRRLIEEKKLNYWLRFLEGLRLLDRFYFVKTDRDFIVDLPDIRGKDGVLVEDDKRKGGVIMEGLGKRGELEQEEEGLEERVVLEKELVEEYIMKQSDEKAVGVNGLGGKIVKMVWGLNWGESVELWIFRKSLKWCHVPGRFRESIGVVMRKPNKPDYSLPSNYRVINLQDVLEKGLERVVVELLAKWYEKGMGGEQRRARKGRSSLEAGGKLLMKWEEKRG